MKDFRRAGESTEAETDFSIGWRLGRLEQCHPEPRRVGPAGFG